MSILVLVLYAASDAASRSHRSFAEWLQPRVAGVEIVVIEGSIEDSVWRRAADASVVLVLGHGRAGAPMTATRDGRGAMPDAVEVASRLRDRRVYLLGCSTAEEARVGAGVTSSFAGQLVRECVRDSVGHDAEILVPDTGSSALRADIVRNAMWDAFLSVIQRFANGERDARGLREAARDVLVALEDEPELPLDAESFLNTPIATFQYIADFVGTIQSFSKPALPPS